MSLRRSDRRALILLFTVCVSVWAGVLIDRWLLRPAADPRVALDEVAMDTLTQKPSTTAAAATVAADSEPSPLPHAPETFAFDPNTADSATLVKLGLAPWMAKSILKYRAKGGRYHRSEDFKRVPGMTPELYERLAPVITIGRAFRYYDEAELRAENALRERHDSAYVRRRDSLTALARPAKFKEVTVVDLNTADTTLLQRIPGIGTYRSRQIVRYRQRLGGYVSTAQLAELDNFPADELTAWFTIAPDSHQRININSATVQTLGRHPYIGFPRARAIEAYRKAHGRIRDLTALSLLPDFTDAAIQRMRPYICY